LAISDPGDPSECEADSIADRLIGTGGAGIAADPTGGTLQRQYEGATLATPVANEEREVKAELNVGQPLEASRRRHFENRLGVPLNGVRVHTDPRAAATAQAVGALAYTLGNDVVFAPGQFAPHSAAGEKLLAHEIAHVVGQRGRGPSIVHRQAVPRKDWDPAGPKSGGHPDPQNLQFGDKFTPEVVMTPAEQTVIVGLGHLHTRQFSVAEQEFSVTWTHRVHEFRGDAALKPEFASDPDGSHFSIRPRVVGARVVRTVGQYRSPHSAGWTDAVDVTYETPRPRVVIEKMDGVSSRGLVPVLKSMQSDEKLVVTGEVRTPGVGESAGEAGDGQDRAVKAAFSDNGLTIERVWVQGVRFTVELVAQAAGGTRAVKGDLQILPYEARAHDVEPATIDLVIHESKDADKFGPGRAYDVETGIAQLRGAIHGVYDKQITALQVFEIQRDEDDPPAALPLWKSFMKDVVKIAFGAISASIGVKIADWAMVHFERQLQRELGTSSEAWHEVIKVFSEQSINTAVDSVAGPHGEDIGGPELGMKGSFHKLHMDVLTDLKNLGTEDILVTAKRVAEREEREEPRLGVRHLLQLADQWSSRAHEAADRQFSESFQAWSTLLARNAIGGAKGAPAGSDPNAATKQGGTDLTRVIPNKTGRWPGVYMEDLYRVPGVLYLDIRPLYHDPEQENQDPTRYHSTYPYWFEVTGARIGGLKNQALRDEVKRSPIGSLRIPVVATYIRDIGLRDYRFTVGRNELNESYGTEQDPGILQQMTGLTDTKAAAEAILRSLAPQTVSEVSS